MNLDNRCKIANTINEVAAKTRDEYLNRISDWVKTALEKEHKPSVALICFNLNHSDRLKMVKDFCGVTLPEDILRMIDGEPAGLILDYNDAPVLRNERTASVDRLELGLPFEFLKRHRVIICEEIQSMDEWLEFSAEIDAGCLVVNATMAMTQSERAWLDTCAKQMFAADEIAIVLTKTEFLNDEEDLEDVRRSVMNALRRFDMATKVIESENAAFEWMTAFSSSTAAVERRDGRVLKNGLAEAKRRIEAILDAATIDATTIQSATDQLEKKRKYLELAGQMVAESVLANSLNNLKLQLCDAIRDYGCQMGENIRKKVETMPLDLLDSLDDKINGYISGSWEYYIKSMMSKAAEETEAISRKLVKQMEIDAGSMVADLDESARRTVYSALGLSEFSGDMALIDEGTALRSVFSRSGKTEISVGAITDQLRKETRNMMLLSIPMLFVNPLASVGTVFAAKAYGKFKLESKLTDIRSETVGQIDAICYEIGERLANQVGTNIEDEIRKGSVKIKSAYGNLVGQIEASLCELKKSQGEKAALRGYLSEQLNVVFPGLALL